MATAAALQASFNLNVIGTDALPCCRQRASFRGLDTSSPIFRQSGAKEFKGVRAR
jgi:hypothetical protein